MRMLVHVTVCCLNNWCGAGVIFVNFCCYWCVVTKLLLISSFFLVMVAASARAVYKGEADWASKNKSVLSCCCSMDAGHVFVTGPAEVTAQITCSFRITLYEA